VTPVDIVTVCVSGPGTVYLLTDDEDSSDLPMSLFANEGNMNY